MLSLCLAQKTGSFSALNQRPKGAPLCLGHVRAMLVEHCVFFRTCEIFFLDLLLIVAFSLLTLAQGNCWKCFQNQAARGIHEHSF